MGHSSNAVQVALGEGRALIDEYSLKKRGYLGNTSMSSEWSFVMANQALARSGSLVFDPFVGTGTLLYGPLFYPKHVIF